MGAGKTSVGLLLAKRLNMPFFDTDRVIEARAGCRVAQIFASQGEPAFREMEREVCLGIPKGSVAALGGGAFLDHAIREKIRQMGLSIFLDWPFSILVKRIADDPSRPLSTSGPELQRRFSERYPVYATADMVWKSCPPHEAMPEEVAETLLERLENHPSWNGGGDRKNAEGNGSDPAKV